MAGRGKRSKVPFDVKKGTRGSPRLWKPIGLLSIPLEIRQMILTACIKSKWKEGDDDSGELGGYGDAHWQLSHTIPQSLLQVSHQICEEAFHTLATYPFTVVCNVWCSGEVEGRIQDPEEFHAWLTIQTIGLDYHPEHARVHKQIEKIAPKTTKLRLLLHADDDHRIAEDLEACRWSLVDDVFLAMTYWRNWQCVDIDLEGIHQAMQTQTNLDFFGVWAPLGRHLEKGWKAICEELEPLREKASTFEFGLKGWVGDHVLKTLEKP